MRFKMLAVIVSLCCLFSLFGTAAVFAAEETSDALFLQSVRLEKEGEDFIFTYRFDKDVSTEEKDITQAYADKFVVNRTPLSEVSGAEVSYVNKDGAIVVQAALPAASGLIAESGSNRIYLLAGFESETGYITTVRYIYEFSAVPSDGKRIYKSDNIDDYEEVTVTSISIPEVQGSNFVFYIYLSESITPRKYIDLQVRNLSDMLKYHGETGDKQYSDSELQLLYDYQIFSKDWENSIIYNLQYGCESYNGLEAFPGNNSESAYDMTPQANIEGIDMYTVYQIQEQVADSSLKFVSKSGEESYNGASQQPLAAQVHVEGNEIQFVLKGDSFRDDDVSKILTATGKDTGRTSFNENIAPSRTEKMAVTLKSGLLFPNGKIIKEDQSFYFDPQTKQWHPAGTQAAENVEDETLSNQEGYTDEELAALEEQGGSEEEQPGQADEGGCGSSAAAGGITLAMPVVLAAGAALIAKKRRGRKAE